MAQIANLALFKLPFKILKIVFSSIIANSKLYLAGSKMKTCTKMLHRKICEDSLIFLWYIFISFLYSISITKFKIFVYLSLQKPQKNMPIAILKLIYTILVFSSSPIENVWYMCVCFGMLSLHNNIKLKPFAHRSVTHINFSVGQHKIVLQKCARLLKSSKNNTLL